MKTGIRRIGVLLVVIILLGGVADASLAEDSTVTGYTLGVGDTMAVSVWGHEELTVEAEVRPDGFLTFPLVGDIYAVGLTPQQLADQIEEKLAQFVVEPRVTAMVRQFRTFNVQVLGEVRNAGVFPVTADARIMDAVGLAGGATNIADLSRVTLTRIDRQTGASKVLQLNLERFVTEGDISQNPHIQEGDVIHLLPLGRAIVLGAVRQPGGFTAQHDMDVLDLLAEANGALETADLQQTVLRRRTQARIVEFPLDLQAILSGKTGQEFPVFAGDVLIVPEKRQVVVLGEVKAPGTYPLNRDARLVDVIGAAGGTTDQADVSRITVSRAYGDGGEDKLVVDARGLLLHDEKKGENPRILGGDVVFVPEGRSSLLILGEVRRPGAYAAKDAATILDAIGLAGGVGERAALDRVTLTRESEGELLVTTVDVADLQQGRQSDQPLQSGDVLFVPEGSPQVLLLGQVRSPGSFRVHSESRLLDIIAQAGGLTDRAGQNVLLTRDGNTEEIDLGALSRLGLGNRQLRPGDVVYVTEGQHQVLVLGEVRNPGYHQLGFGDRLVDALGLAGGALDSANLREVSLTREENGQAQVYRFDVNQLLENRFLEDNMVLQGGDVLIVPAANRQVLVLGEVRSPGSYVFQEGQRVLDLIGQAGGFTAQAAANEVQFTREMDGKARTEILPLAQVAAGGEGLNPTLSGGDLIYVPEGRQQVLVFGQVRNPGYYPFEGELKLLDALARAGGLSADADGRQVTLTRQTAEDSLKILEIDAEQAVRTGEGNIRLVSGDTLYVPPVYREAFVLGDVVRPGMYSVQEGESILDLLTKAGGPTEQAHLEAAVLTKRSGERKEIDLKAVLADHRHPDNVLVEGGDSLYMPRVYREVLVLGEVARPGMYRVREGQSVLDLLGRAGGPTEQADLGQVVLTSGEDTQNLNIGQLLENRQSETGPLVSGGDVIYVPTANQRILVLGQVQRPGAYPSDRHMRLLDAVAAAGGPTQQAAVRQVTLTRSQNGEEAVTTFDLEQAVSDEQENPPLVGGDIVYIPLARQILVFGEVNRPGAFNLPHSGRILDLLALAGGLRDSSEEQELILTRQGEAGEQVWSMKYGQLIAAQAENNLLLNAGDVLYLPQARRQVLVLGQVARPGVYNIPNGARVLDAIALAGGPQERAALEKVGIYRDGDISSPATLTMGRDKLLFEGSAQENPPIMGGDVIFVPETSKPNWTKIFGFLGGLRTFQQLIEGWK